MSSPSQKSSKMEAMTFLKSSNRNIINKLLNLLSFNDIMSLTLVSKDMNNIISTSRIVKEKKMKLSIAESWNKEFEFEHVSSSRRRYNTLEVKSLLRRSTEISKAICFFSNSLTTIITTFDFSMGDVKLPQLRDLTITMNLMPYLEDGLLSAVNNLMSLHLVGSLYGNPLIIVECLKSNSKLISLDLEGDVALKLFKSFTTVDFEFKLSTLRISCKGESLQRDRLLHFVRKQPLIKELKMSEFNFYILSSVLDVLENLERLTYSPGIPDNGMMPYGGSNIPFMTKMKQLNLMCDSRFKNAFTILLYRMPGLRKVYFAVPSLELMYSALKQAKLQEFSYAFFETSTDSEDRFLSSYEKMKCYFKNPNVSIKKI